MPYLSALMHTNKCATRLHLGDGRAWDKLSVTADGTIASHWWESSFGQREIDQCKMGIINKSWEWRLWKAAQVYFLPAKSADPDLSV